MAKVGTIEVEITNKVKAIHECVVCGRLIPLIVENHYVATDKDRTGLSSAINREEPELYDCFDCPHCGCQNVIQERKRLCPCDYGICDECKSDDKEGDDNGDE